MEWTDSALRQYLLGSASPETAEQIEARVFDDDELFAALRSAEDDLLDAWARGTLSPAERALFLERYGHQTDRLRFAEAIARRVGAARAPRTAWWGWRPLAAAAILIIVAGAIFNQLEAPAPVGPSRAGIPASPAAAPAPAGPAAPFVVALALGTSRTPGATPVVVIPSRATLVLLNVQIDPADRFDTYTMELRGAGDRTVWSGRDLTATAAEGRLVVSAQIPADRLVAGPYELAVRGGGTDLGFLPLTVRWAP